MQHVVILKTVNFSNFVTQKLEAAKYQAFYLVSLNEHDDSFEASTAFVPTIPTNVRPRD